MDAFWTFAALFSAAVVTGIVSPLVVLKYTAKQRDRDKAEEEERRKHERLQDLEAGELVRAKVEEAARLLKLQDEKIERTARKNELTAKQHTDKLDVIHTLVDGQMTAMMEDQLDMAHVSLALLKGEAARSPENAEAQEALRTMEEKVRKLTAALADRKHQMAVAEEQIRQQGER